MDSNYSNCLKGTYTHFFIGILIFSLALLAYYRLKLPIYYANNFLAILVILGLLIGISIFMFKMKPGFPKYALAVAWILLLAYLFYPLVTYLTPSQLLKYVLLTILFFGVLTLVAFMFPNTFLSLGKVLLILLIGVIILGLLGFFLFRSERTLLIYYLLIIVIFSGLILFDTQMINQNCKSGGQVDFINNSAGIFIDTANLFGGISGAGTMIG